MDETSTTEGELVPVGDFVWEDRHYAEMRYMTCANHPTARYLTKNPSTRSLHFTRPCVEAPVEGWPLRGLECPCPFRDMVVISKEGDKKRVRSEDSSDDSPCGCVG